MKQRSVHYHEFRAMDCDIGFWLSADDSVTAAAAFTQAEQWVHAAESTLSRFRPDSELSRLNAASGRAVRVSPLLGQVLMAALEAARSTQGMFDPALLHAIKSSGYDRTFREIANGPIDAPEGTRLTPGGWRGITMEQLTGAVTLPAGVGIDLGGIAKGWLADAVAADLSAVGPCLVDMGGDLAARGAPAGEAGWAVGVADPRHPDADLAVLVLRDCGIATSGRDYRVWRTADGRTQHHIIDPRTGHPAITNVLSATVIAATAATAELLAKVALLLGAPAGAGYLHGQNAHGVLVCEDGDLVSTPGFSALPQLDMHPGAAA